MVLFDEDNWLAQYQRSLNARPGVFEGRELASSGQDIAAGQGTVGDYINVAAAPLAFTGYGLASRAGAGLSSASGLQRILAQRLAGQGNIAINMPRTNFQNLVSSGGQYVPNAAKRASVEDEPFTYGFMYSGRGPVPLKGTSAVADGRGPLATAANEILEKRNIINQTTAMGNPLSGGAASYLGGDGATMVLRDSVRNRSTISPADMNPLTTPAAAPSVGSEFADAARRSNNQYLEARVSGGVDLGRDVEKILVPGGRSQIDETRRLLQRYGYNVPVEQARPAFREPNKIESAVDRGLFGAATAARSVSSTQRAILEKLRNLRNKDRLQMREVPDA